MEFLLEAEVTELFHLNLVELKLPEEAEIYPTLRCARCEEGVMSTRVTEAESRVYCLPCAVDLGLPLPAWFDSGGALVE